MAAMFSRLSGLQADSLLAISDSARRRLEWDGLWALTGLLLCGLGAGYLTYTFDHSPVVAGAVAIIVLVILLYAQAQLLSSSGLSCGAEQEQAALWRPHLLRSLVFILLGAMFAQPLLLAVYAMVYQENLREGAIMASDLALDTRASVLASEEDRLRLRIEQTRDALSNSGAAPELTATTTQPVMQSSVSEGGGRRKALLIGNQRYLPPNSTLNNPVKDARDLAAKLSKIGFQTTILTDSGREAMERAIVAYVKNLRPGDISLFYFSGHGFQAQGYNFLVPSDAVDGSPARSVGLSRVVSQIDQRHPAANVVIIDACRNNAQDSDAGLASIEKGENSYIALAAKPGQSALDGIKGSNGYFTGALLKYITEPIDIDSVFRKVRADVYATTRKAQETWTTHSLKQTLVLADPDRSRTGSVAVMSGRLSPDAETEAPIAGAHPLASCLVNNAPPNAEALARCGQALLAQLQDDLVDLQAQNKRQMETLGRWAEKQRSQRTVQAEAFYSVMENHVVGWMLATLLLTVVISGGFVSRDLANAGLLEYEQHASEQARHFVIQQHQITQSIIDRLPWRIARTEFDPAEHDFLAKRDLEPLRGLVDAEMQREFHRHWLATEVR